MEVAVQRIQASHNGYVDLCHLGLTSLPELPDHITCLWCNGNRLKELPELPPRLFQLRCDHNELTRLPPLPSQLRTLRCDQNYITSLPDLPESLRSLWCDNNHLTSLPLLPTHLVDLWCEGNRLLPPLTRESPKEYEGRLREYESKMRIICRVKMYKEDLMMNRWHPSRVEKLLEAGYDIEDM